MFKFINFLNLPAVKVKKSKANNEYLHELFITKDKEGLNWEKECTRALFSGDIDKFGELTKGKHVNIETYLIDLLIDMFGSGNNEYCLSILEILNNMTNFVKNAKIENNMIIINTKKSKIEASRFSDIPKLSSIFPNLTVKNNRKKQCHNFSIKLTLNADFDCKIATGYVSDFSNNAKYLHSWVETKTHGTSYVIDLTKNIIINKQAYYMIQNISSPVYKISQKTFIQERDLFNDIARKNKYLSKLYLSNRPLAIAIYNQQEKEKSERENSLME